MEEPNNTSPACFTCGNGPIPAPALNELFAKAQVAAIQEFLQKEPIAGHTNGCILLRMVSSGLQPDIVMTVLIATNKDPRIIRPGEVVN